MLWPADARCLYHCKWWLINKGNQQVTYCHHQDQKTCWVLAQYHPSLSIVTCGDNHIWWGMFMCFDFFKCAQCAVCQFWVVRVFLAHTHIYIYIYNVLCISWPHTEHLPSCSPLVEALQRPKDKRKLAPKDAASTCREAANVLQEAIAQLSAAANVFEAAPATATAPQSSVAGVPPVVQVGRKGWEDGRMGVDTWKSLEIHRKVDWLLDWFLKGATVLQAPWIRWWVGSYNVISTPLSCITSIHLQSAVSLVLYQMDVGSSTGPLQSGALQLQVGL